MYSQQESFDEERYVSKNMTYEPRIPVHVRDTTPPFTTLDEYKVYRSGTREVSFSCMVTNKSIEHLKKCILDIIHSNQHKLEKRHPGNDSEDEDEDDDDDGEDTETGDEEEGHRSEESESGKKSENKSEKKPFTIRYIINTYGGCLNSTFGFVGFINSQRDKYKNIRFESVIIGSACSAGTVLAIIADHRKMDRFAKGMIHELSAGTGVASFTHLSSRLKNYQDDHDNVIEIYVENTGRDINNSDHITEIEKLLNRETYMTSDEYLELGFIDEIIGTKIWVERKPRCKKVDRKVLFPGYRYKNKTRNCTGSNTKDVVEIPKKKRRR